MIEPLGVVQYVVAPIDKGRAVYAPTRYAVFMRTKANPPSEVWYVTVVSKSKGMLSSADCEPILGDNCFESMSEACHVLASCYQWPLPNHGYAEGVALRCLHCGLTPADVHLAGRTCPKSPAGAQFPHEMVPSGMRPVEVHGGLQ